MLSIKTIDLFLLGRQNNSIKRNYSLQENQLPFFLKLGRNLMFSTVLSIFSDGYEDDFLSPTTGKATPRYSPVFFTSLSQKYLHIPNRWPDLLKSGV